MTSAAAQNPPKDPKRARHPKLTTKSGMPSGMTTSTAQTRRPGRSVRSTSQAKPVPSTAHSAVTTTVRLTVFQTSWAVRPRKSSGCSACQPTSKAWTTKKISGVMTASATKVATPKSSGGCRRRPGR